MERTAYQQLGGEQGGVVHIEAGCHIGVLAGGSVYRGDIGATSIPVRESLDRVGVVVVVSSVGKASVTVQRVFRPGRD